MDQIDPHLRTDLFESLHNHITAVVRRELAAAGMGAVVLAPRELRIRAGKEIRDVAFESGVSAATISRIESGKILNPSPQTLAAIAAALGVPAAEYREAFARYITVVSSSRMRNGA